MTDHKKEAEQLAIDCVKRVDDSLGDTVKRTEITAHLACIFKLGLDLNTRINGAA